MRLAPHPSDPRVLLTAGWDGRACVLDVASGATLASFLVLRGASHAEVVAEEADAGAAAVPVVQGPQELPFSALLIDAGIEGPPPPSRLRLTNAAQQPAPSEMHSRLRDCCWLPDAGACSSGGVGGAAAAGWGGTSTGFAALDDRGVLHLFGGLGGVGGSDARFACLQAAPFAQYLSHDLAPTLRDRRGYALDACSPASSTRRCAATPNCPRVSALAATQTVTSK
jgi:hypothetical protein